MHSMPGEAKTARCFGTTSRTTCKTPMQLAWADDHTKVRMHAILHSTKLWDQFNATVTSVKIALEFKKKTAPTFVSYTCKSITIITFQLPRTCNN